jgi:hypothetical protein
MNVVTSIIEKLKRLWEVNKMSLHDYTYDTNYIMSLRDIKDVKKITEHMPYLLDSKIAVRSNNLGSIDLNDALFDTYGSYKGIGLGCPPEYHDKIRPLFDKIYGDIKIDAHSFISHNKYDLWSYDMLSTNAHSFISARTDVTTNDIDIWIIILFHKIALDIEINYSEAQKFNEFKRRFVDFSMLLPQTSYPSIVTNDLLQQKEIYITMYIKCLKKLSKNHEAYFDIKDDYRLYANAILESFIFAGGLSITKIITSVIYTYFHEPKLDFDITKPDDLELLIFETIRLYSPVKGTTILIGGKVICPMTGLTGIYNKKFKDSFQFKNRRNVNLYKNNLTSWNNLALPLPDRPETARTCPAKSLSIYACLAFLTKLELSKWECVAASTSLLSATNLHLRRKK